jgi:chromosome segregation ATPase
MEKHIEWFHAELQEVRRKLSNIQTRHYAIESKITEDEEIIDDYFEKVDDELSEILSEITGTQIRVRIYRNRRAQSKKGHTSSWYARYIDPSIEEQTKGALDEIETPRTFGPPPGPSQDN